jgi:hypothetical protein
MSTPEDLTFAPMLITDIFAIHGGTGAPKADGGPVPYVAASFQNNGVVGYVEEAKYPGGWLSFVKDGDGGAGTCFYQPAPFWPSNHVFALEPKNANATEKALMVMAATITHQCFPKYNRGFAANATRLSRQKIMVPVTVDDMGEKIVDWEGMNRFGKELFDEVLTRTNSARQTGSKDDDALPVLRFEPMYALKIPSVQDGLFLAHKGRRVIAAHRKPGGIPFVAGSRDNNSIVDFSDVPAMFPAGWLTLIYNGDSAGYAKYQPAPFSASDDVIVLEPASEEASGDALIVAAALLTHQCVPKYGFGHKLNLSRFSRQKLLVPITTGANGETIVDWAGMGQFGRSLRVRAERAASAVLGPV